jgi:hypothetical protein
MRWPRLQAQPARVQFGRRRSSPAAGPGDARLAEPAETPGRRAAGRPLCQCALSTAEVAALLSSGAASAAAGRNIRKRRLRRQAPTAAPEAVKVQPPEAARPCSQAFIPSVTQDFGLDLKQVGLDCYDPTQAPQERAAARVPVRPPSRHIVGDDRESVSKSVAPRHA